MVRSGFSRWLLPVSLSLNVFLGVTTAVLRQGPDGPRPPPSDRVVEEIAATLPAADALALRRVFADRAAVLAQGHRTMQTIHDRIRAALAAPAFDPAALKAALAEGRKDRAAVDDVLEATLVEAAGLMSAEGRRRLSEWAPPPPGRR